MVMKAQKRILHYIVFGLYFINWILLIYAISEKKITLSFDIIIFLVTTVLPIGISYLVFEIINKNEIFEEHHDVLISSFFSISQVVLLVSSVFYLFVLK